MKQPKLNIIYSFLICTVFLLFFENAGAFSPKKNDLLGNNLKYEAIDAHARKTPKSAETSLPRLVKYLTKPARNEREKVRSFYVWLTHNIAYDVKLAKKTDFGEIRVVKNAEYEMKRIAATTLKHRKGVCQGYAELFKFMCKLAKIECEVVKGFSRKGQQGKDFSTPDHAWNAAFVDGKWALLDITWGAGSVFGGKRFEAHFSEKPFLENPKTFVHDHLPNDPAWQLLACPVSLEIFKKGEKNINTTLAKQKACFDFEEEIAQLETLPPQERALQSAENAYRFNRKNKRRLGMAYMNYGSHLARQVQEKIDNQSISIQDHSKSYEKIISVRKKGLTYLNDEPNFQAAMGFAYLNYGIAIGNLRKEQKGKKLLKSFEKSLAQFETAKKWLKKGKDKQAKQGLNSCEKNIKITKDNIRICKKRLQK